MKIVFIFLFLNSHIFASSYCKDEEAFNSHFIGVTKIVKVSGDLVASSPMIAKQADMTLSKLIAAKSPLVIKWISKRKFNPAKDEDKIVKEWRKYFLENFILSRFPTKDIKVDNLVNSSFVEIASKSFNKKIVNNFISIFEDAKNDSLKYISSSSISVENKSIISEKIKALDLYWFEGLLGTKYEKMPLEFLRWGLAYDPVPNEINVGILALSYNSNEEIYATLLHEIAHSFDPCRWSALVGSNNPFNKVVACLRSESSVGAKKRDDSKLSFAVQRKRLSPQMAEVLKSNPTCNKSFYPLPGMQRDQILEVFADWFSSEVLANGNSKYLNNKMRRDLCRKNSLSAGSSYILNNKRLKRIYFANPLISNQLKQESAAKYCHL